MHPRIRSLVRHAALGLAALVVVGPAANAQVQAAFFAPFVSSPPPNPNLPFPAPGPVCVTNVGGPTGFSLNFVSPATQSFLAAACGPAVASQLVHSFGARFTGSLMAPAAGSYTLIFNADDGDVLTINGVTVASDWFDKGGGPGSITVALNAGANPFVFDYYENTFGGAFATLELPPNLPAAPPVLAAVPEPATVALLGTGLLVVVGAGAARRRPRA